MKLEQAIKNYFNNNGFKVLAIQKLGEGFVAEGYKVEYEYENTIKKVVCRRLKGNGMSHDYLSDRVAYLLLQHEVANFHPKHIKSVDVVSYGEKLDSVSLEGLEDVFQIVEFAEGDSYYKFIEAIQQGFDESQKIVVKNIAEYMKAVHKIQPKSEDSVIKNYYWRHSQDFIGSEVLMDILDVWPLDDLMPLDLRIEFVSKLYKIREETRQLSSRCTLIHSDLHPDNIRVDASYSISVLDSARTMWGEPMDDLTSMLANYLFFGLKYSKSRNNYENAYSLLLNKYFNNGIDSESNKVARLFFSIRLIILAHPLFFSSDSFDLKNRTISIAMRIASDEDFDLARAWKLV